MESDRQTVMKTFAAILLVISSASSALGQRKCCPNNEIIKPGEFCGDRTHPYNVTGCTHNFVVKDIVLDGTKLSAKDVSDYEFTSDPNTYCVGEMLRDPNNSSSGLVPVAIVCFQEISGPVDGSNDMEASGILTLISVFFLLATFAIYMYLPQLRDLQGLCYMCMCISMALGFLSLGVLQLNTGFTEAVCTTSGFIVYFWMVATFFWMNVICINVYRTVIDSAYLKRTESKQFFIYSCYAWGATLSFLLIAVITNFVEGTHLKPGIGNGNCWFTGRKATWLYFYGPIALIIAVNVALFVLSSLTLWRETRKYEVNKLNILRHKFLTSLKLFLVMGISWVFEIASFAHNQSHIIWKIMDTFNCLQGVVIFLILVILRKRAIQGLLERGCCLPVTRPLAEKLNPHDESDDQQMLADETAEVRLN